MQTDKRLLKKYYLSISSAMLCLVLTACEHTASTQSTQNPTPTSNTNTLPIITLNTCEPKELKIQDAPPPAIKQLTLNVIRSVYSLSHSEINKEIKKLKNPTNTASQIKKALLLSRTLSPSDSQKALSLLAHVVATPITQENESEVILARFLYPIIEEQHKTYQTLVQQNKEIKEQAQEIANLKDKLKALRAIEDSLSSPPPEGEPLPLENNTTPTSNTN